MTKLTKFQAVIFAGYALMPLLARAQTLNSILTTIDQLLNLVIPVLFVLATVIFLWGIIRFLTAAGDPEAVKQGRSLMLWGIVALAVMAAVWGLVKVVLGTFGIQQGGGPTYPSF